MADTKYKCVCAHVRVGVGMRTEWMHVFHLVYLIKSGSQGLANIVFAGMLIPASLALGSKKGCAVNNRLMWASSKEIRRQFVLILGKIVLSKFTMNNKLHSFNNGGRTGRARPSPLA